MNPEFSIREAPLLQDLKIQGLIQACMFSGETATKVYYPANSLFKLGKDDDASGDEGNSDDASPSEVEESEG